MTNLFRITVGLSSRRPNRPRPGQAGVATLAVAVIMLLVVSVLVFHSHTAGWLEQRATANQARAKQAHAAAEAGLEVALAALNDDTVDSNTLKPARERYLTPSNGNFSSTGVSLTGSFGNGLTYSVSFTASPSPANTFKIESTGESDCSNGTCSGRATVSQVVRVINISVLPAISISTNPPFSNPAAFFENVFGASQDEVKALTTPINNGASLGTTTSGLVWHEGNLTLNTAVGAEVAPVLLVVAGDLTLESGAVIHGFVHVTGNLICNPCDQPAIRGAVAIAGTSGLIAANVQKPNPLLVPNALTRLETAAPRFAKVIGTWRDW